MPRTVFRLAAGAILAASLHIPTWAETKHQPGSVEELLRMTHMEKHSSLSFQDENGNPISGEEFLRQINGGKLMSLSRKKHEGGDPDVSFRLTTKEQIEQFQQAPSKVKRGEPFPEFHLKHLDGSPVDNDALKGKYTVISFYFATCAPCIKEVPELNALRERRKDLNLLAVTFDSPAESRKFVEEHHLNWGIVPEARSLINAVGVKGFPTLALLDPQGKVVDMSFSGTVFANGGLDAWLGRKMAAPN